MQPRELCKLLNLPLDKTKRLCSINRGNVLCWSIRELLCIEYYRLDAPQLEYFKDLLTDLIQNKPELANGKSDGFVKGQFVLSNNFLHRKLLSYCANNPFGVIL